MCAHDAERCDVAVLNAVRGVFFHFGEDVAYDAGVVVRSLLGARDIDCDVG